MTLTRSVNLNFFAAEEDQKALLDFIFARTDLRVFESYSEYGCALREFHSTEELASAFALGTDRSVSGTSILLRLSSPSVFEFPRISYIDLDPRRCKGHTFRYCVEGWHLMQLYLGGVGKNDISFTHFGHGSQIRADSLGATDAINWEALKKLSNQIQYHLRNRLAVAKAGRYLVLPQAFDLARSGFELKEGRWAVEIDRELRPRANALATL